MRATIVLTAGLAWLAYAGYEYAMLRRWLCSGECNVRIDLLLIYPALGLVSLAAMVVALGRVWTSGARSPRS